jgi:transcriptional regulator with XRE-family HTH domain
MGSIDLTNRDIYAAIRRKKKIKLKEIADYIGCCISIISEYERGTANMSHEKINKYREYIDNHA